MNKIKKIFLKTWNAVSIAFTLRDIIIFVMPPTLSGGAAMWLLDKIIAHQIYVVHYIIILALIFWVSALMRGLYIKEREKENQIKNDIESKENQVKSEIETIGKFINIHIVGCYSDNSNHLFIKYKVKNNSLQPVYMTQLIEKSVSIGRIECQKETHNPKIEIKPRSISDEILKQINLSSGMVKELSEVIKLSLKNFEAIILIVNGTGYFNVNTKIDIPVEISPNAIRVCPSDFQSIMRGR